jgi:hypothetical protein
MGPFLTAESLVDKGYIVEIQKYNKNRLCHLPQAILCDVLIYRYFSGIGI